MSGPRSWAVIGGGMMGMTIALRLARAEQQVTLYEAAERLGGLASPWTLGDVVWDRHYHVTLLSDLHTRRLMTDLGLEENMRWVETKTGFLNNGELVSMSNALEYLRLPGLSLVDKARIAATIVYASRLDDWRALEQIGVEDWLVSLGGRSAFERLWRPLLASKLGEGYRDSSAAFIWATIQRLYAARRTGLKKEMFGYVPGGYARIVERFAEVLDAEGVTVHTESSVEAVRSGNDGIVVHSKHGAVHHDRVVVTTTPRVAARMCTDLHSDERDRLAQVPYQGIVCASLLLERPLAGYYLTYLTDDWVPFTAVVEMTAFVDSEEVGGRTLVYLPKYAAADDPIFDETDDEIRTTFVAALTRIFPDLRETELLAFRVSRVKEVFPLPRLRYSTHLPPTTTSVSGLSIVSSAHIINGTLNVNDTLRVAERAAKSLVFSGGQRVYLD